MYKVVIICMLGVLVQNISGQYIGCPCRTPVVSASLGPGGTMSICSDDLLISGPITVAGKLPFSGTCSLEGSLPAAGAGAVNYECGEPIGIIRDSPLGLVNGYVFRQGIY